MKKTRFEDLSHEEQILVNVAKKARKNAFTPYFRYKVGAAVLSADGKFYSGCNVESPTCEASHGEMVAIDAMVADGGRRILKLCCVAKNGGIPDAPCRQKIWNFSGNDPSVKIIGVDLKGNIRITTIGELYPYPFGPQDLGVDPEKY